MRPRLCEELPLYGRKGTIVFVDDDPSFVEMLVGSMPRDWRVKSFLSGTSCVNFLQQQPPLWEAEFWAHQRIVDAWRQGASLVEQLLRHWTDHRPGPEIVSVCVTDHFMPGMDGLEMLLELGDWPGKRVLLTGHFDGEVATDAFNAGHIDRYVAKQSPMFPKEVVDVVAELQSQTHPRHTQIWSATLSEAQTQLLRAPRVAAELNRVLQRCFREWVIVGEPFGALGVRHDGRFGWLQLEAATNLPALAEVAEESGASAAQVRDVLRGKRLCNSELCAQLPGLERALPEVLPIDPQSDLLAAFTPVPTLSELERLQLQSQY